MSDPVTGHRVWRVFDWQDAVLGSLFRDVIYSGPVFLIAPPEVAALHEKGGVHAYTLRADAIEEFRGKAKWPTANRGTYYFVFGEDNRLPPHNLVIGSIELSGAMFEHQKGFRAERGTIQSLQVHPAWPQTFLDRLAQRYACEVTYWDAGEVEPPPQKEVSGEWLSGRSVAPAPTVTYANWDPAPHSDLLTLPNADNALVQPAPSKDMVVYQNEQKAARARQRQILRDHGMTKRKK